jgi:serine protease Do
MEEMKNQNNLAKTVVVSSGVTLLIVLAVLFIARKPITTFLLQGMVQPELVSPVETVVKEEPLVTMVAKANPAVVSVVVTKDVPVYEQYYETFGPWGVFSVPRVRENGTQEREVGGGSGFIVSNDGLIVTNNHVVVDEVARYSIVLTDGTIYTVDVLARDADLDVAILKINQPIEKALSYLDFGDSTKLQLGQTVVAIGNALAEFQNSISVGVVSGLSRSIVASDQWGRSEQLDQVIQTDAAINPGNSGGPLLNKEGEVIGVNVATSRGADNIGFALPAEMVKQAVDSVKEHGEIIRPYLGVRYAIITPRLAKANNLSVEYGVLIVRGQTPEELAVMPGSPADKAGLQENDIILSVDGFDLKETQLTSLLRAKTVGQVIILRILSKGEEKTVLVTLEKAM